MPTVPRWVALKNWRLRLSTIEESRAILKERMDGVERAAEAFRAARKNLADAREALGATDEARAYEAAWDVVNAAEAGLKRAKAFANLVIDEIHVAVMGSDK